MNPNENYEIVDGRIQTRSLEIHVVDHCNLRCWGCCSLSQISAKRLVEPEEITRDLALAKKSLAPARLKLVGGEPLLHPRLIECLVAAREAHIAPSLSVTTNGILLSRVNVRFWELVDHVTISLYPGTPLSDEEKQSIKEQSATHSVELNWKKQDVFVGMDRETVDTEGLETREIYTSCWLRRRCHLIAYGRFYTCTRPSHFHAVSGLEDSPYLDDGVLLDSADNLYDYLVRKEPLHSCAVCMGGNANESPHRQLSIPEAKNERLRRRKIYQQHASSLSD